MDIEQIASWFLADSKRMLSDDQAVEAFHLFGARCRFIKTLGPHAALLDVGAGDGALQIYRNWPFLQRRDIRIFAYAGEKGRDFHRWNGFETGRWPEQPPMFDGIRFDAIMACNFIEHIDDPLQFVRWACKRVAPHGWIYLEWPRPESLDLPTTADLRARGINVMTGNYLDDATHRPEVPQAQDVHRELIASHAQIETCGVVRVPFLDREMASVARSRNDIVGTTLAYWSFTGWCQYVVARLSESAD